MCVSAFLVCVYVVGFMALLEVIEEYVLLSVGSVGTLPVFLPHTLGAQAWGGG